MESKERIISIELAVSRYKSFNAIWEDVIKVFGTQDNALHEAFWQLFDDYLNQVSWRIKDPFGCLGWYIYENDCGAKGLEAKASNWKKMQRIDSIEKLVKLIEADDRPAKQQKKAVSRRNDGK